jgi:hypothetical protein
MSFPREVPKLGITLPCQYRYAREADMIQLAIGGSEFCVRLIDCWAPPREGGLNLDSYTARAAAQHHLEHAKQLVLWVPAPPRLDDLIPLQSDLAGFLFISESMTLNELLVNGQHCTRSAA